MKAYEFLATVKSDSHISKDVLLAVAALYKAAESWGIHAAACERYFNEDHAEDLFQNELMQSGDALIEAAGEIKKALIELDNAQ